MALGGRRRPRSTTARAAAWGLLPGGPAGAELLRRHLPAAVAVRPADGRGRCSGCPAAGRGTRRWSALSPLLFVHAFTNWDLFAVALATLGMSGLGAAAGPCSPACCSGWGSPRSSTRCCCSARCFLLCLRAGRLRVWLRTAAAAARRLAGGERADRRRWRRTNWAGSSAERQPAGRPGHDLEHRCCTRTRPAGVRRPARRGADRRRCSTPSSPCVARAAGRPGRLADAGRAACGRGSPSSPSCSWPASCCSTRSGARSTRCGCCRWRCWPGRAGGRCCSGRRPRCLLWVPTHALVPRARTNRGVEVEWFFLGVMRARPRRPRADGPRRPRRPAPRRRRRPDDAGREWTTRPGASLDGARDRARRCAGSQLVRGGPSAAQAPRGAARSPRRGAAASPGVSRTTGQSAARATSSE